MSNDNRSLRTSSGQDSYDNGRYKCEECNFDDEQYANLSGSDFVMNAIKDTKEIPSHSEQSWKKNKLKRLRGEEYDVEKASKYFESYDFRTLEDNSQMEVSGRSQEVGQRPIDASVDSDNEGSAMAYDSDVSTSSCENSGRSTHSGRRKGSYDFVSAEENVDSSDAEICDDAASRESESDSDSDSDQEHSDASVTDSEISDSIDENEKPPYFDTTSRNEAGYPDIQHPRDDQIRVEKRSGNDQDKHTAFNQVILQSDELNENKPTSNKKSRTESYERACSLDGGIIKISDKIHFQKRFVDSENHMDTLHYKEELDSDESEEHVEHLNDLHSLIRKPAMRRRGYAWGKKNHPMNNESNRMGLTHHERDLGSSIDPSLYDHIVTSGARDKQGDNDHSVPPATKTQSLPARTDEDTIDGVRYKDIRASNQRLQSDRPASLLHNEAVVPMVASVLDNKNRPLNRGSNSPNSLAPYPRLRKKANINDGDNIEIFKEDVQNSRRAVVDHYNLKSSSSPGIRHNMNIGLTMEDENGERYQENASILSETGIFRNEAAESSLARNSSVTPSSPIENTGVSEPSLSAYRSNRLSHSREPELDECAKGSTDTLITSDQEKQKVRTSNSSQALPDPQFRGGLPNSEVVATSSPEKLRRSSSSSSRHEARLKFFTNYEEFMSQSPTLQAPVAEEMDNIASESQSKLSNKISPAFPLSSSLSPNAVSDIKDYRDNQSLSPTSENTPASTPATTAYEGRRGNSSKIMRSSERSSRRSERRGSSSKHDGLSSSSRSGFSRSSKKRDLTASSEQGNRSSQGFSSYVSRVVTEIVESERMYIASLEDIIHGYLEPMEKILISNDAKKDIECLFSNIRDIYKFGCVFLADLEMAGTDCVKVAQCFVRHNKGFVIYTDYCTNYPRAVEVLTRFMQHPELSELCKERQFALGHGLPLGAYLLKPVQRILKYHLLLHNIVKSCEKEQAETGILEQAFHHMTEMAQYINEMKRKHEHAVRIQEIQSQLEDYVGEDLTRLGELVLEGAFKVYGAKASRQVFLFERGLLISKKKEGGMLSCKTFIKCSNLMLVEVIPNEPLSFHIIPFDNPRAQYTLQARNMEQKRRWCQDIKQLILESFKGRIPDNVKNLIMQLGREHDDDYISKESLEAGRKNQHTAPEYLEKRRFRMKSGSRIPDFSNLIPQKAKRGGNKKGDVNPGIKALPEMVRRAASKSPEGRHRIFTKQNVAAKGRSRSSNSPVVPISTPSESNPELNHITTKTDMQSSPTSACTSPESPVYRRSPKFTSSNHDEEETAEGIKRPASFLMARANPVFSADLTQLLARCGGSVKMQSSPQQKGSEENEKILPSLTNLEDLLEPTLRDKPDTQNSSDDEQHTADGKVWVNNSKPKGDTNLTEKNRAQNSKSFENITASSEPEISLLSRLDQSVQERRTADSKLTSSHALEKSLNSEDEYGEESEKAASQQSKRASESAENIYENINISKTIGHMSRRDMQAIDQTFRRKGANAEGNKQDTEASEKERKATTGHDINSKTNEENALKVKGLRLPNTSKHLLAPENEPDPQKDGIKAKLTNWNSVDKLTKGSMDDLSHLDEDPWVRNPQVTNFMPSMEAESPRSSRSSVSKNIRPRGHSDVTDMMQVANNKVNMDWMVYLNRNSQTSLGHQLLDETRVSTSALDKFTTGHENSNIKSKLPSEISYATPPREHMTIENMKRLGSMKDNIKAESFSQDHSERNSAARKVNAFGLSSLKITTAKPVSFTTSGLSRSNSTPISDTNRDIMSKAAFKIRPISLDMDKLTNESNRMVEEMKEYIKNTSESNKNFNTFPTTLPIIKVEEESDLNRLSVVSSISSSSYESQSSSSSDGLVGTLKSKLYAWAKNSGSRQDSEISCASTLTSDEEDTENVQSKSGNISESSTKNRNSWKEDRQLETVLREHSLGSTKLGSRMAHSFTQPVEQVIHHHFSDSSAYEPNPKSTCGFASMNKDSDESVRLSTQTANSSDVRSSRPPTTETTEALLPHTLQNCDIQQSDSGFSLQSDESNMSDPAPPRSETALVLSEESSEEGTSKAELKMDNTKIRQESANVARSDSSGSLESKDSCYERKLSAAFESDIFQEKSEIDKPNEQSSNEALSLKKSIREYVKDFEEKIRYQTPKVFEVKRREPSAMIRQRLQTLRESALYGWRNVSTSSGKPYEEKSQIHSHHNIKALTFKKDGPSDSSIKSVCLKPASSRDSLSKSVENLSKSRDSVFLSRSRDSLNSMSRSRDNLNRMSGSRDNLTQMSGSRDNLNRMSGSRDNVNSVSDAAGYRHSAPVFSLKANNSGHEKDVVRFHYKAPDQSQAMSGNQFIHRAYSSSQRSASESEESDFKQTSKSVYQRNEPSIETNNLVVMKGWVRSLISKFQVQS